MARELKRAGINPRELKPGTMRAATIAYVGRDPRVARIWDKAKARLKETPDYRMWVKANEHIKSLKKTQQRYAQLAARGQVDVHSD